MTEPTAALQRLGLSKYEAEVFVALQQIDSGTASEVADLADVPRSQVYGAAEDLEDRGLVDVQHASPKRYRAVTLEEAREQLRRDFEREHERAFDALESIEDRFGDTQERQEAIWTLRGSETIDARIQTLLDDAESSITFGGDASLASESLIAALIEAAEDVDVLVVSEDATFLESFADTDVETAVPPDKIDSDETPNGRFVIIDRRTVLFAVVGPDDEESAFWSSGTTFAKWHVRMLDGFFSHHIDL
ncbi:hypothetical protein GCM10028857_11430 [Salinarchaeum chitinilyticum]